MRRLLIPVVCLALLTACGERHKAKTTIKAFLKDNVTTSDYHTDFFSLDSTRHVGDSTINALRSRTEEIGIYNKGVTFGGSPSPDGKLLYMRARIITGSDTVTQTFYLSPDLKHVVAVK